MLLDEAHVLSEDVLAATARVVDVLKNPARTRYRRCRVYRPVFRYALMWGPGPPRGAPTFTQYQDPITFPLRHEVCAQLASETWNSSNSIILHCNSRSIAPYCATKSVNNSTEKPSLSHHPEPRADRQRARLHCPSVLPYHYCTTRIVSDTPTSLKLVSKLS